MTDPTGDRQVTRADIEAKLEEIRAVTERGADASQGVTRPVLVVLGVVVLVGVYLIGRRRGRKRSTIVEVRRI